MGFSHSTWQPASSAANVRGLWNLFGVATLTMSSFSLASIFATEVYRLAIPA